MSATTASTSARAPAVEPRGATPVAALPGPISEATARLVAVLGIAAIAIVHILDAAGTYQSTRYIFWLYLAVIAGAVPIMVALLHWHSRLAWVGAAALALGPFVGYVLSRSVGLPGDAPDVGNWLDTLGMVSLFVEISVIGLSMSRLALAGQPRRA